MSKLPEATTCQRERLCPPGTYGVLVICMYSGLVGGLPFVVRAAFLACVGGLAILEGVCLRGFLL